MTLGPRRLSLKVKGSNAGVIKVSVPGPYFAGGLGGFWVAFVGKGTALSVRKRRKKERGKKKKKEKKI